jgi:hypothetical protein
VTLNLNRGHKNVHYYYRPADDTVTKVTANLLHVFNCSLQFVFGLIFITAVPSVCLLNTVS